MTTMNLWRLSILVVGLALAASAGCTADIRPEKLQARGIDDAMRQEGRVWLDRAATGHGGVERWRAQGTMSVVLRDRWPGFLMRTLGMPWAQNGQRMRLDANLGSDNSRLVFLGGPDDSTVWGIQHWVTWRQSAGADTIEWADDDDIRFWLPTIQYFIETPFRLLEADVVGWAGEREIAGQPFVGVYATWGDAEPQADVDQYLVWIHRDMHLIGWLEYTVRDKMRGIHGVMRMGRYKQVQGIKVPFELAVVDALGDLDDDGMHTFEVESVEFGARFPKGHIVPDPTRRRAKYLD